MIIVNGETLTMSRIKANIRVKVFELNTTMGMLISQELLDNRRLGKGTVITWVPGHGGDVWLVVHLDGVQSVYSTEEMKPLYGVICRECGEEMEVSDIRTVADKAIVELILDNTDSGIGVYRCKCGSRIYLLCKKEE